MPPRTLKPRRPSSSSGGPKKTPNRKLPVLEEDSSVDHDYHHRRLPIKDAKEPKVDVPRMVEESCRSKLGVNELFTNVEENGRTSALLEDHWTGEDREKEEVGEGVTDGADILRGCNKFYEDVEAVGDENNGELHGFEEEDHDVVKQRRKKKEYEVFVGGLDRDTTEEDLRNIFSQVGEITELRLLKNPLTNKNKGFAFIQFATVEQARRAVSELKQPVINGKKCGVARSQDNDTLFLGNICKEWTKETLKEKLAHYGVENFEELTLIEDLKNEGKNRGFAFLDFFSRADALEACKRLQRRDIVFGTDRKAKVAFAEPVSEPDEEIMLQVRQVFIDGLPSIWDEDCVKKHVKKFGRIEKVELARNMPAAKRTDFGFITFDTHDAAVACVNGVDNAELAHGDKKVKVRARLTKPRHRGRLAKHARGYPVEHGSHRDVKDSRDSGMSSLDPWKLKGHSGRSTHSAYDGVRKQSIGHRNRHIHIDVVPDMVQRRRQFASPNRSFRQRSPDYGSSLHGDHIDEEEYFSGPTDFVRAPLKRQIGKVTYTSRGSGYSASSRKDDFHVVACAMTPYDDDDDGDDVDYERYMEPSSNHHRNHIHEYFSLSGSKRAYSAYEEDHSRHGESSVGQSGRRFHGGQNSFRFPYGDGSRSCDSKRMRHDSHSTHDEESWRCTRHSHGQCVVTTSSRGYRKEGNSRGDGEMLSYTYDKDYRDFIPSRSDLGSGSFSPVYRSDHMSDGYSKGKGSDSYY